MAAGFALGSPEYRVGEQGPDHEKEFHARVVVGEEVLGEGHGRSKKEAEQKAAKEAWHTLDGRRTAGRSPDADGSGTDGSGTDGSDTDASRPSNGSVAGT